MMESAHVRHVRFLGAAAAIAVLLLTVLSPTASQGQTAQVTLLNVPAILDAPYASELRQRIDLGFYGMQFTYLNPLDATPVGFSFQMNVYHEDNLILEMSAHPNLYAPGTYLYRTFDEDPPIDFALTFEDVIDQMSRPFREILIRTGMLPEGRYRVELAPVVNGGDRLIATIPALAEFEVRYPAPPLPLTPAEEAIVATGPVTFSWTPVFGFPGDMYEYDLLLVEVEPTQQPLQAIASNRAHTGGPIVTTNTTFTLTPDFPPLEAGATYAYQITAREINRGVPLADEGRSEIVTFTFGSLEGLVALLQPAADEMVEETPTFTWTTTSTADHEFALYHVHDGMTPEAAVSSTEPLVQTDVTGRTAYAYDGPPLAPGAAYAWLVRLLHPVTTDVLDASLTATFRTTDEADETLPPVIARSGAEMDVLWPILGELSSSYPPPIQVRFPDLAADAVLTLSSPTLGTATLRAADFDADDIALVDPQAWPMAASLPAPVVGTLYEWDDLSAQVLVHGVPTADPAPFSIAFVYTEPTVTARSPVDGEPVTVFPPPIALHVDGATPGTTLLLTSPELGVQEIEAFEADGTVRIDPNSWEYHDGPPPVPDSLYSWELGARVLHLGSMSDFQNVPISFAYSGPLVLGRPSPIEPGASVRWSGLPDTVSSVPAFTWTGVTIPAGESSSLDDDVAYRVALVELNDIATDPYAAPLLAQAQLSAEVDRTVWQHTFDDVAWQPGQTYAWYVRARDLGPRSLPIREDGRSDAFSFVYTPDPATRPLAQFEVTPANGEAVTEYPPPITIHYPGLPEASILLITSETRGVLEIDGAAFDADDTYVIPSEAWYLEADEPPPVVGQRYDWDDFLLRTLSDSLQVAPTPFTVSFTYEGEAMLGPPGLADPWTADYPGVRTLDELPAYPSAPALSWWPVTVPDGLPPDAADAVTYTLVLVDAGAADTTHGLVAIRDPFSEPSLASITVGPDPTVTRWSHTFDQVAYAPDHAYAWYVRAEDTAGLPTPIFQDGRTSFALFHIDPDAVPLAQFEVTPANGEAVTEYPPPITIHYPGLPEASILLITSETRGVLEIDGAAFDADDTYVIPSEAWYLEADEPPPVVGQRYDWDDFLLRTLSDSLQVAPTPFTVSFTYEGEAMLGPPQPTVPGANNTVDIPTIAEPPVFEWIGTQVPDGSPQVLADEVAYRVIVTEWDDHYPPSLDDTSAYGLPPIAQAQLPTEAGRTDWSYAFPEADITWQPGQQYAWYVHAVDLAEPPTAIRNDGYSPAYAFVYDPDGTYGDVGLADGYPVVEDIAWIRDDGDLTVDEAPDGSVELDGPGTLVLDFTPADGSNTGSLVTLPVVATDLTLPPPTNGTPILPSAGRVDGSGEGFDWPFGGFSPGALTWDPLAGLQIAGRHSLPVSEGSEADPPADSLDQDDTSGGPTNPIPLPPCLADQTFDITFGDFLDGTFEAALPATLIGDPGCDLGFGSVGSLWITDLGGVIEGDLMAAGGEVITAQTTLGGYLALGEAFQCPQGGADLTLGQTALTLHHTGLVAGLVAGLAPQCTFPIGPFAAETRQADLRFGANGDRQAAHLDLEAALQLGDAATVVGQATFDLIAGELDTYLFAIDQPFTLNIPSDSLPTLAFRIDHAELSQDGLLIDGLQTLDLGFDAAAVTFNDLLLDIQTMEILQGDAIIDEAIAFKATIDEATFAMTFEAVPGDADLGPDAGALLRLAAGARLDADGFTVSGQAETQLNYGSWALDSLIVAFSDDFAFRLAPFQIAAGRMDFLLGDQSIAHADAFGFHPDISFFLAAALPERLPLPHLDVAYLTLKDADGNLLVDFETGEGTTTISTPGAATIGLVLPLFQGDAPTPPTVPVSFTDLTLDAALAVTQGSVAASVGTDPQFDLPDLGIPLALTDIAYESRLGLQALHLDGLLHLLDQPTDCPTSFAVQANAVVEGTVSCPGLDAEIPLGGASLLLDVTSAQGTVAVAPLQPALTDLALTLDASLELHSATDLLAGATVTATLTEDRFTVDNYQPTGGTPQVLDLGPAALRFDGLTSFFLSYDYDAGWDFLIGLDLVLQLGFAGGQTVDLPLRGTEISPDGVSVPAQIINDATDPALPETPLIAGPAVLTLLEVETDPILLGLDGLLLDAPFIPTLDLALSLPGLAGVSPDLAASSFTVEDATLTDGLVDGTLVPYTFMGSGAYVGFEDVAGLYLTSVAGSLSAGTRNDGTSVQEYTLDLTATPQVGSAQDTSRAMTWTTGQAAAALSLSREALRGTITGLSGSGYLDDAAMLSLTGGTLEVEQIYTEQPGAPDEPSSLEVASQTLEAAGRLVIAIGLSGITLAETVLDVASSVPENVVRASGTAVLDLLTGQLVAGSELVAEALQLAFPVGHTDPLFAFAADQVTLTAETVDLHGEALLDAAGTAVDVLFDHFTLAYDGTPVSGTVSIDEPIGFQFDFPSTWSLLAPNETPTLTDGVWFTLPPATLGVDGLTLAGTGGAGLYLGGTAYEDLSVDYDSLTLTFPTSGPAVAVASGQADFNTDPGDGSTERLAYLDANGFHLDNLFTILALPDRVGLPTEDVAYLEVRDPQSGVLLVETSYVVGGTEIRTVGSETVRLVFPTFDDGGTPLSVDVGFTLTIDDAFAVTGGALEVDLSSQPLSLDPYGLPLDLLSIAYTADAGLYALTAGAQLQLPASLAGLDVDQIDLTFGPDGFEHGQVDTGTYTTSCPASPPPPIATADLGQGALTMEVGGTEIVFGAQEAFRFSGTLTSDLFAAEGAPGTAFVCYAAAFTPQGWTFQADASNLLNGELPLGVARLVLNPVDGLLVEATDATFDVLLNGTLYADEMLGADFALAIDPLRVGTSGVVLEASTLHGQTIPLFDGIAEIELTRAGVTYAAPDLTFDLDGTLSVFDRTNIAVSGLQFGTDGSLTVQDVGLLPGSQEIEVLPDLFVFDDLRLAVDAGTLMLVAGGTASLPEPFEADAAVTFELATDGTFDVDGPAFVFDTGYQIGNNPSTEFSLGTLATLDLTAAALDLGFGPAGLDGRRPLEAALLATAAVYFESDPANRLTFGTATDILNQPGFTAATDGTVTWSNVAYTGTVGFDTDFFAITLTSAKTLEDRFGLELDAQAGLRLDGVSGTGALDDMVVSERGLEFLGRFGGATFAAANMFALEVGTFQEGSGEIEITRGNDDPDNPAAETETIQTEAYLLFTGGTNGGDALGLTLDALGASGGVSDVLYYKKPDGGLYLSIRDAQFSFNPGGLDSEVATGITASFTYETDGAGGFGLDVGGAATIGVVGGALAGTISTLNNQFSAGLFVAFNAPIPILPGIVELTGAGGGFFYNPSREDRDLVLGALSTLDSNLEDFADEHAAAPFEADDFMVMLYASAGVLGTGGVYLVDASTYLELTDASFTIYGRGTMIEEMIETELDLSVVWGGGVTSVEGSALLGAEFGVLASAEASADFALYKEPDEDAIWAITLGADAEMLNVLTLDSDVIVSPDGFYAAIEVVNGFDIAVVSFETTMAGSFWVYTDGDFGAWGEATIEASVLFGAAKIGGGMEAALIKSGSTDFLYGALTGYVSIVGFEGDVTFWIAVEDGHVDFGEGENPEFDALIAEAKDEAEDMADQAEAIADAIEEMETITFSDEELAAAGAQLMMSDWGDQLVFSLEAVGNEFQIAGSEFPIAVLYDQANDVQSAPGPSEYQNALADFQTGLDALGDEAGAVIDRLSSIEAAAIGFTAESSDILADFPSGTPVQTVQVDWQSCRPLRKACAPGFTIDRTKAREQAAILADHRAEIQALDAAYAEAIATVEESINELDDLMAATVFLTTTSRAQDGSLQVGTLPSPTVVDPSVNGIAEDYTEILEDASAYFAQHLGYLWALDDWAVAKESVFDSREDAIRSTMETLRTIYEADRDYALAQHVIEERWQIIKELELLADGLPDAEAEAEAATYAADQSAQHDLAGLVSDLATLHSLVDAGGPTGAAAEPSLAVYQDDFYAVFEASGMDLWYELPAGGVELIQDDVPGLIDEVVAAQEPVMGDLMGTHRDLTAGIDAIYAAKANLLADLYGLYEIYALWRASAMGEGADDVLRDQQAVVAQQLEAPLIQDVTVHPVQGGYYTYADLSWSATHPAGTVEHALMITGEADIDLSTSADPVSVGGRTSFRQYTAREGDEMIATIPGSPGRITKNYTATVRARGEGGVTASRVASYSLTINADGSTTGSAGSSGSVLAEDTTAPTKPTVTWPYPLGEAGLSYWAPTLTELDVELTATDAESDIVAFEVALGTTLLGLDVLGWTPVYGTWTDAGANDVSGTRTLEATIHGLSLEAGGTYFVHARAINGDGLVSPARYKLLPVTIDPTPPTWDVAGAAPTWQDVSARTGQPLAYVNNAVAPLAPATGGTVTLVSMDSPAQREDTTEEPATVEVSWTLPAIDDESGLLHYEYVVLTHSGAANAFSNLYPIQATDGADAPVIIADETLTYDDAHYLYLRAINRAGVPGTDIVEIGPIELTDPSGPTTPALKAQASADGLYLYVTTLADDQETKVLGYRYALGTTAGGTDVVPFRTNGVDLAQPADLDPLYAPSLLVRTVQVSGGDTGPDLGAPDDGLPGGGLDLPDLDLPDFSALPVGEDLYVQVKAVNADGRLSAHSQYVGPFQLDTSPPDPFTVTVTYNTATCVGVNVTATNVRDDEVGLLSVEYKMEDANSGAQIVGWTPLPYDPPDFVTTFGLHTYATCWPASPNADRVEVTVRAANTLGLDTEASATLSMLIAPSTFTPSLGGR